MLGLHVFFATVISDFGYSIYMYLGVIDKTIIPRALVGYEIVVGNSTFAPRWLSTISYPTRARGIIAVTYN